MGAQGTATIDFGNAPSVNTQAVVAVTGQTGIGTTAEAWIEGDTVADPNGHSADEHLTENVRFRVGTFTASGFTIYGECTLGTTQGQFLVHWVWN